jgi:hypothetical protein
VRVGGTLLGRRGPLIGAGAQAARQTSRRIWPTGWRFFADEVEIPPWRTGPFEPQSVTAGGATVARWLSRTLPEVHRGDSLFSRARTAHSSTPGRDGLARPTEWSCQAFHGHKPSISTSSEKLNTILISTISPSTPTLSRD